MVHPFAVYSYYFRNSWQSHFTNFLGEMQGEMEFNVWNEIEKKIRTENSQFHFYYSLTFNYLTVQVFNKYLTIQIGNSPTSIARSILGFTFLPLIVVIGIIYSRLNTGVSR